MSLLQIFLLGEELVINSASCSGTQKKKAKDRAKHVIHLEMTPNGPLGFHHTGY